MHFKIIESIKSNKEILDTLIKYTYKTTNGKIKTLENTNYIYNYQDYSSYYYMNIKSMK